MRISAVEQIPVPSAIPLRAGELEIEYVRLLTQPAALRQDDDRLESLLTQIDATVQGAYDLPPGLEHQLMDNFRNVDLPVAHLCRNWDVRNANRGRSLAGREPG